jgi:glutathione S-transferase
MTDITLVLGTKNTSSWSLRPWLLARHLGVAFREELIALDQPDTRARLAAASPTARVPVLRHGTLVVWESIAICQYLCELAGAGYPEARAARAVARAVSAEMHAGFSALRSQWPLNACAVGVRTPMTTELAANIARVQALWSRCRGEFGESGPWLFGTYCIADAMFAPVVLRFRTYGAALESGAQQYQQTALADPYLQEWLLAAAR